MAKGRGTGAWVALLVMACWAEGQFLAPWVGANVKVGEDPAELPSGTGKNQAEPHVIRSRTDPDLLLATFQEGRHPDGGARANGYAVSEDGGFTWRRALNPHLTQVSGGAFARATDPVAGIALDGTLYLNSLVSPDEAFVMGELVVQRSEDRGQTWSPPLSVYLGTSEGPNNRIFPDKNWMVVNDYPDTPTTGRVVVTWTNFRTQVNEVEDLQDYLIMAAYSDNRGDTWSTPVFVTPPDSARFSRGQFQGSQPVFLPGGGLALVYHRFPGSRLEVVYSPDGGVSFPFGAVGVHNGYLLYDDPLMRDGTFLPTVGVARETGDLYIAYTARESPTDTLGHIFFVRSDRPDKGSSPATSPDWRFRAPMRISGDQPARSVNTPTVSVTPDGQRVTVFFFDNRNRPPGQPWGDFYAVQSTDGGSTWTAPFRVTESTFDLRLATNTARGYMIGDYFGFAAPLEPDQAGVAVWVDTRDGTADPWSARIGGLEAGVFGAWLQARLPHAARLEGPEALRLSDPDLDGTPNLFEYLTGRAPWEPDSAPGPATAWQLSLPDPRVDPATRVELRGLGGRWPTDPPGSPQVPQHVLLEGGFWNRLSWPDATAIRRLGFLLEESEQWYLLEPTAPVRWVRAHGQGWSWSPWFGWLYTPSSPWIYHSDLGWLYDAAGILYSPAVSTWLYPSPALYPWVPTSAGSFLYVLEGTSWIFDTAQDEWFRP